MLDLASPAGGAHSGTAPAVLDGSGLLAPPIAILSFNRPALLQQVLDSLLAQQPAIDPARLHLFQDGTLRHDGSDPPADREAAAACVARFRAAAPAGTVHLAPRNLGIAWNFDRAERHLFDILDSEIGFFFEDDMLLSPHYLAALEHLSRFALAEERVGYVAAYGDHRASPEAQATGHRQLVRMHHNWGFALTRRHWRRQRPIVEGYLRLLGDAPYAQRPAAAIHDYYASLGLPYHVTSQDGAKQVAGLALGTVRLTCLPSYGHYLGEHGTHYTPDLYAREDFGNTRLFPEAPMGFDLPDDAALDVLVAEEQRDQLATAAAFLAAAAPDALEAEPLPPRRFVAALYRGLLGRDPDPSGLDAHAGALNSGTRTPEQLVASLLNSGEFRTRHGLAPQAPPPPALVPRMDPEELALFRRVLAEPWRCYLEYGTGGSTAEAARLGTGRMVSVESDPRWLGKVAADPAVAAALAAGRAELLPVELGPLGEWGTPADPGSRALWPRYAETGWAALERAGLRPDLVLVDGRFRVACCLSVALAWDGEAPPPRVLVHDMGAVRPHYAAILDHFTPVEVAGTLFLLEPKKQRGQALLTSFLRHQFDPR
ncbi:DUF4214 domain-containing protein [Roseomonas sp. BN140053]|uniref:DUF4214 domain-containing protein n=1 Tax=Roseomonas sp. BN140053 TaxID=3391898 RepID=UPI0039E9A5C9